jgi:DNA replication protein DnaC
MESSLFSKPKEVFLDVVDAKDYIQLDSVSTIYQSLKNSVKKPLKMILLYGRPGTGKSMLLQKLYQDLSKHQKVIIYHTPLVDEEEFLRSLARDIYSYDTDSEINFTRFNELSNHYSFDIVTVVFLDDAQLY